MGCESARSASWAIEEALKERLELPRRIEGEIAEYKKSPGFKRGLQRSGRVIYKFGYRVAFARFSARYMDLELEPNPFIDLLEDQNVDMPTYIPFDDDPETPLGKWGST